jgi:hypothetical protein
MKYVFNRVRAYASFGTALLVPPLLNLAREMLEWHSDLGSSELATAI